MPRKQKNEQQQQNTHQFNRNELLNDSKCFRAGIVKCGRISTCITFLMKSLPKCIRKLELTELHIFISNIKYANLISGK